MYVQSKDLFMLVVTVGVDSVDVNSVGIVMVKGWVAVARQWVVMVSG